MALVKLRLLILDDVKKYKSFVVDSGIAQDGEGPILNHTLDLTAEADNTPLVEPRLKMITHKQVINV